MRIDHPFFDNSLSVRDKVIVKDLEVIARSIDDYLCGKRISFAKESALEILKRNSEDNTLHERVRMYSKYLHDTFIRHLDQRKVFSDKTLADSITQKLENFKFI